MSGLRRRGERQESGYVTVLAAVVISALFLSLAALGVDTARWYVEVEQVQKAADAAALAGVVYMPADLARARTAAINASASNGYPNSGSTTVTVSEGSAPSELVVTVTSTIANSFASGLGITKSTLSRSAVADYTAPAPMGSPCNTFGNEPPSQPVVSGQPVAPPGQPATSALPSTPFPNCSTTPQFWAAIEGPATDKVQGDRYMTTPCTTSGTYGCASNKNTEGRPEGYFFAVHVEPGAVGTAVDVQAYDPAFVYTTISCTSLPTSGLSTNMNDYTTTDGTDRYAQWKSGTTVSNSNAGKYCSGDYNPGSSSAPTAPPTTSFAMREQTDTGDPLKGAVISGCSKQFRGISTPPTAAALKKFSSGTTVSTNYNPELARVFHQWVSLCTFTPTRSGDYFLQVRTNVAFGGSEQANANTRGSTFPTMVSSNTAAAGTAVSDTASIGLNSFALRAVPQPVTDNSKRSLVSVAGFSRMPILQNASTSSVRFNLIRALPATRGQYVAFNFYDVADGTTGGTVKVIAPTDATGSVKASTGVPGCKWAMNDAAGSAYTTVNDCTVNVSASNNNGQVERIVIPIPTDYNCSTTTLGGCWFAVEVDFKSSAGVTDFTTWDANIGGDPVRLVE